MKGRKATEGKVQSRQLEAERVVDLRRIRSLDSGRRDKELREGTLSEQKRKWAGGVQDWYKVLTLPGW